MDTRQETGTTETGEYAHPLISQGIKFRRAIMDLQHRAGLHYAELKSAINGNRLKPGSLVDVAFLMQEVAKYADMIRKEASKIELHLEKIVCAVWTAQCAADPNAPGDVGGEIAVGVPTVGMGANVPEKHTDEYKTFMRAVGVPDTVIEDDVVRPHWPHVCKMLTDRAEQGLAPPAGIDPSATYSVYHLKSLRVRKGATL